MRCCWLHRNPGDSRPATAAVLVVPACSGPCSNRGAGGAAPRLPGKGPLTDSTPGHRRPVSCRRRRAPTARSCCSCGQPARVAAGAAAAIGPDSPARGAGPPPWKSSRQWRALLVWQSEISQPSRPPASSPKFNTFDRVRRQARFERARVCQVGRRRWKFAQSASRPLRRPGGDTFCPDPAEQPGWDSASASRKSATDRPGQPGRIHTRIATGGLRQTNGSTMAAWPQALDRLEALHRWASRPKLIPGSLFEQTGGPRPSPAPGAGKRPGTARLSLRPDIIGSGELSRAQARPGPTSSPNGLRGRV